MSANKIRALNDAFRTTMTGGKVFLTAGVDALPFDVKAMVNAMKEGFMATKLDPLTRCPST